MNNTQPTNFKPGDRVRVIDSCTAKELLGQIGTVIKPSPKYKFRVGVQFYCDRDYREIFFHPCELEVTQQKVK